MLNPTVQVRNPRGVPPVTTPPGGPPPPGEPPPTPSDPLDPHVAFLATRLNPEVWRPSTPLAVTHICKQIARERRMSVHGLVATWQAMKTIMVFSSEEGLLVGAMGMREIAHHAHVSLRCLAGPNGYIHALTEYGLIEVIGQEEVAGHAGKPPDKKLPPRNIYGINLPRLEQWSIALLPQVWHAYHHGPALAQTPPADQHHFFDQLNLPDERVARPTVPATGIATGGGSVAPPAATGQNAAPRTPSQHSATGIATGGGSVAPPAATGQNAAPRAPSQHGATGGGGATLPAATGFATDVWHPGYVRRKESEKEDEEEGAASPPSPDSFVHPNPHPDTALVALRQRVQDLEALVRTIPAQILTALQTLLPHGLAAAPDESVQSASSEPATVTVTRTEEPVQLHVGTVKRQLAPARAATPPPEPSPLEMVPAAPAGAIPLRQSVPTLFATLSGRTFSSATAIRLQTLADEIDAATDGFGLYWLGRAILLTDFCLLEKDRTHFLSYLRTVLRRWLHEGSWGSDRGEPPRTSGDQGSGIGDRGSEHAARLAAAPAPVSSDAAAVIPDPAADLHPCPPAAPVPSPPDAPASGDADAATPGPVAAPPPPPAPAPAAHRDADQAPVSDEHAEAVLRIWKEVGGHEKGIADLTAAERTQMVAAVRDLDQWRDFLAYWVSSIPDHDPAGRKPKKRYNPGRIPDLVRAFAQYVHTHRAPPDKTEILLSGLPPTEMERWLDRFQRAAGDVIAQERVLTDVRTFLMTYTPPPPSRVALRPALPKARRAQIRAQRAQQAQQTTDQTEHRTPLQE